MIFFLVLASFCFADNSLDLRPPEKKSEAADDFLLNPKAKPANTGKSGVSSKITCKDASGKVYADSDLGFKSCVDKTGKPNMEVNLLGK